MKTKLTKNNYKNSEYFSSLTYKYVSLIASFFLAITSMSMSMSATRICDKFGTRKCDSQKR